MIKPVVQGSTGLELEQRAFLSHERLAYQLLISFFFQFEGK